MANTEIISKEDLALIENKKNRINNTISNLESDIKYLSEVLSQYSNHLDSRVESSIEESDIIRKYNSNVAPNTYNMPGVFASTVGNFDIESSRADQKRLESLQKLSNESNRVLEASFTSIIQTYNKVKSNLNLLAQDNQLLNQYLDDLKLPQ